MRCLIVEDHPLTRDGTAMAMRVADELTEIFEAASLRDAFSVLDAQGDVDLVLLDLALEDSSGVATLKDFKAWCHARGFDARIVVLSASCEPALVREVVNQFATGFILKATPPSIFRHAVALTLAGGVYIPEVVLRQMGEGRVPVSDAESGHGPLSKRETEVASLLIRGFTYKRIAKELERMDGKSISEHTVRAHVGNIAWKLGVTENAKAGVMAEFARRRLIFPAVRNGVDPLK